MTNEISEIAARLANDAIDEIATEPVDDTPTLIGYLNRWAKKSYFMAAADHTFDCKGPECITFLALSGLETACINEPEFDGDGDPLPGFEPILDPRWVALRDESVDPDGEPSEDQINRLHALAVALL